MERTDRAAELEAAAETLHGEVDHRRDGVFVPREAALQLDMDVRGWMKEDERSSHGERTPELRTRP